MIDVRARVERLLDALTTFGRHHETELFRERFERANWQLTEQDLTGLQAALTDGLIAPHTDPVPSYSPARRDASPARRVDLPSWLAPLSQHAPYLVELDEAAPGASFSLIERVNGLLAASSYSQFYEAARELFVEEFRFDDLRGVDELPRLPTLHSFSAIRRAAAYDDFPVFVVEDNYGGPHPNVYNPLFQLSHRCVVLAFHSNLRRLRIVFRGHDTVARYRTLVGRVAEREDTETVLTLARRFSALRPSGLESGRDLEGRARRAFAQRVEALVDSWSAGPIDAMPTGASWSTLLSAEVSAFLSRETTPKGARLHFGLEAVFRNRFPIPLVEGAARLCLLDWEVVDASARDLKRWSLIAARATRSVTVRLKLETISNGEVPNGNRRFEIDVDLPLPDDKGELIIDGTPGQLCFHLDQDGDDYVGEDDWREMGLELDDEIALAHPTVGVAPPDPPGLPSPVVLEERGIEGPENEQYAASRARDRRQNPPRTCSMNSLWTFLVERRLAALAHCLWRTPTIPDSARDFLRATRSIRARSGTFSLIAPGYLWRHVRHSRTLERITQPLVRQNREVPPAWACLEAARHDPNGYWVPIASARLHPDGRLSIPVASGSGWRLSLSEASAHDGQARWNQTDQRSDPRWWLCDALSWFAGATPGAIGWPARLLQATQSVRGLRIAGERFRILIARSFLMGLDREAITSMRVCDVPAPVGIFVPATPRLLAGFGARVGRGDAWLSVPRHAWTEDTAEHVADSARHRLADATAAPTPTTSMYLGPDEHGIVSWASLVERRNPLGRVVGWRAAIQLRHPNAKWVGALQDGRTIGLEVVGREEMPFDENGNPLDVCVVDPLCSDLESGAFVFAPDTGELAGEGEELPIMLGALCPWADACPPDIHLRYRALDGEGLPADGSSPQIDDDWRNWLAAVEPEQALLCDTAEQRANAGAPPALSHLHDLAVAIRQAPLPLGPKVWQDGASNSEALHETPYDPTLRSSRAGQGSSSSRFAYQCGCGTLSGRQYTSLSCTKCGSRVARTPTRCALGFASREPLPEPSIHPWRKAAVAALCGLSTNELAMVLQDFSGGELCRQLLEIGGVPGQLSLVRLSEGKCTVELRAQIESNYAELQECLRSAGTLEEFLHRAVVKEIRVPLSLEGLTGLPPGASELQAPSVLLRLRHLRAASKAHALLDETPELSSATRSALNCALDHLFGIDRFGQGDGELESFTAWLHRLLPPTRLQPKTHALPGLFRSTGEHQHSIEELRLFGVTEEVLATTEQAGFTPAEARMPAELHLATAGSVILLRRPGRAVSAPDPESWKAQWAYRCLYSKHQSRLAAIAIATEYLCFSEIEWEESRWPQNVERTLIGQVVLRHLWNELSLPSSQPVGLLGFLRSGEHIELPAEFGDAEQRVTKRLLASLPSRTPMGDFVRTAVARVLCGWSRGDVGEYRGVAVQWSPERERAATRFIPASDSFAWTLLPGSTPLHSPERWLLDGRFGDLSPVVRQVMRWGNYPIAPLWDPVEPVREPPLRPAATLAHPAPLNFEAETPLVPSDEPVQLVLTVPTSTITVYKGSIKAWLQ